MDALNVTTVFCPDCGAELRTTDKTCGQCGRSNALPPVTGSKEKLQRLLDRPWVLVVLILHVGFLGIPVYWKTNYSLGVRLMMVIASIVYTIIAVAFILIMLRWLMQMTFGG
ncbi:MAG: zinc ribbon domain-containing protein [Planctomycetota bacterium]